MTITDETWKELMGPASDARVAECIAGTKRWLTRSGGTMAVKRAELYGPMVVLSGVEHVSGLVVASSVPAAEIVARAAA